MVIVYALTRNLYPYLHASMNSLLEHNSPEKIYVLAEDDELDLPEICEVINVSGQTIFDKDGPNSKTIYTYMAMMRLLYVDLIPEDRVIQLDIDTIVCDSLEPLWEMDLEDKWFAACPEYKTTYNPFDKEMYYNIGVCVFNLAQMRKDKIVPKMVELLNTRMLPCIEQDALNYYGVPEKVKKIPVRYNESFCCGETSNPAVVHYAGIPNWYGEPFIHRAEYLARYL